MGVYKKCTYALRKLLTEKDTKIVKFQFFIFSHLDLPNICIKHQEMKNCTFKGNKIKKCELYASFIKV